MGNKASSGAPAAAAAATAAAATRPAAAAPAAAGGRPASSASGAVEPWRHLTRESSKRKFTTSQVTELHEKFKESAASSADPGNITPAHFRQALGDVGVRVDSDEVAGRLFNVFDVSGNGGVDFREFVMGLNLLSRGALRDKIELAFHIFDVDNSGEITKDEMRKVLRMMDATSIRAAASGAAGSGADPDKDARGRSIDEFVDTVFATSQRDQSGTLSFGEFVTSVLKHPTLADLDDLVAPAPKGSLASAAVALGKSPASSLSTESLASGASDLAAVASMAAQAQRRESAAAAYKEAHGEEDEFTRERNEWIRVGMQKNFIRYDAKTGKTIFVD